MASLKQRMQYEDDEEILPQERMQGGEEAEWVRRTTQVTVGKTYMFFSVVWIKSVWMYSVHMWTP